MTGQTARTDWYTVEAVSHAKNNDEDSEWNYVSLTDQDKRFISNNMFSM